MLGNTPAVCRKCYVHPMIFDSYLAGETIGTIRRRATKQIRLSQLKRDESEVLMLIQRGLHAKGTRGRGGLKS